MTTQTAQPATAPNAPTCPRCEALLTQRFSDTWPECIQCGYADYSQDPHRRGEDTVRRTAVRYGGISPRYTDTVVMTSVRRPRLIEDSSAFGIQYQRTENKLDVDCPICHVPMEQTQPYTGWRKNKSNVGFRCDAGHIIVLFDPTGNRESPDYLWRFAEDHVTYTGGRPKSGGRHDWRNRTVALSISQPYATLLVNGMVNTIGHHYQPHSDMIGRSVILHANNARGIDWDSVSDASVEITRSLYPGDEEWQRSLPRGKILGRATLDDCGQMVDISTYPCGVVVDNGRSRRLMARPPHVEINQGWHLWTFTDLEVFDEPILAHGYSGLWNVKVELP